ncbi:uncharacterized protein E6C27_scaffold30G002630 [Cucumis melo var. makuwa]|uniref:Envelope-like protein n=1 Tax=Cucumis melo var. makuwa TaxID=1194695 RepID=A0A5A7TTM5_CUCMM|nr:uncharacterized protein E6C27_scaffold30G002630 [Cucumis melo var. makuwa]
MMNTRKGTYTDKSTEEVLEAPSPRAVVHGVRVRADDSKALRHGEHINFHAKTALAISEAHLSDMNSDDLDDVPLARVVKKVTAPDVFSKKSANHESSSSEGVFV